MQDTVAPVRSAHGQATALVRATRDDAALELGVLVDGRRAGSQEEATVSRGTALDLGVALGDTIQWGTPGIGSREVLVVGLTADPANVDDRSVTTVNPALAAGDTSVWLTSTDPYSVAAVRPLTDVRVVTYQSLATLVGARENDLPAGVEALRLVGPGLGVLLAGVLLVVVGLLAQVARRDVTALEAAGVPARTAWRLLAAVAAVLSLAGTVLGGVLAVFVVRVVRLPLSATFGQEWQSAAVAWRGWIVVGSLVVLSGLAAEPVVSRGRPAALALLGRVRGRRLVSTAFPVVMVVLGALIFAVAMLARLGVLPPRLAYLAPAGALLVVLAAPALAGLAFRRGLGAGTRRLLLHLHRAIAPVVVAAAIVVFASVTYTGLLTHNAGASKGASGAPQPPGSFAIDQIPADAADLVAQTYTAAGGTRQVMFDLPSEDQVLYRATSTSVIDCMARASTRDPETVTQCYPQDTRTPITFIALGTSGGGAWLADPGLIAGGRISTLRYRLGSNDAEVLGTFSAEASPMLGGNLPGLVIPPDAPQVREWGLHASGQRTMVLLDFSELPPQARSQLRAYVSRVAPGAQVADATLVNAQAREVSTANLVALTGGAAGLILLSLGGGAVVAVHRRTRRVLWDLGASPIRQRALAWRWLALPIVAVVTAGALGIAAAEVAGVNIPGSFGWVWPVPSLACLLACVALKVLFLRRPDRLGE